MSFMFARKFRYLSDRCTNAYWMLRTGKFKLIVKSINIEIDHRITYVRAWLHKGRRLDDSEVPWSAFVNQRKAVPPSFRPTESELSPAEPLQVDPEAVASELRQILATFTFQESDNS